METKHLLFVFSVCFLLSGCSGPGNGKVFPDLIPLPVRVEEGQGYFLLDRGTVLEEKGTDSLRFCSQLLNKIVLTGKGFALGERGDGNRIVLHLDSLAHLDEEGYSMQVGSDSIRISASSASGLFYGVQTLCQFLAQQEYMTGKGWKLPCLRIDDRPAFRYRGMHLDVSRHFFSKSFIMKCMDWMAFYKLNRFHWHLTDAGGWRIEIGKYPELTARAAWRSCKDYMVWWKGDRKYVTEDTPGAYGGYYTRQDIREVVAYAAQRNITVIPEIEMPGHSEEVLAVYPELGCYGTPYRNGEFCIGNERCFEFVEDVLKEVMELFPSEYIHIGGDEASVSAWKICRKCQDRMAREGLSSEKELQSYMIHRVEEFLEKHGRKLIGWDEIMEGGLSPGATVMSWRGEKGGAEAARMGHDVIMTPGSHCYFDHYQADPRTQPTAIGGYLPYLKVYSYYPVPEGLDSIAARHVLGAQANVWTEYIPTESHAEYMIFPRLLALSEAVWTPQENKDVEDFKRRLASHLNLLHTSGVNAFSLSSRLELQTEPDTFSGRMKVSFESEKYRPQIRYAVNSGEEKIYSSPILIRDSAYIKAYIVEDGRPVDEGLETRIDYHRAIGRKVSYARLFCSSYPAAGKKTLTDGYKGGLTYSDGRWQGFLSDVDVVIDMDSVCDISWVSARFMQLTGPGVYMPLWVKVSVSEDGKDFKEVAVVKNTIDAGEDRLVIKDFTAGFKAKGRFLQFFAKRQKGFLFVDEIVVY